MPHRRRLLIHVLVGLRSTKTRELVRQHVRRWINARGYLQASHYRYVARWPFSAQTLSALWAGIHSEDTSVQLEAGRALAVAAAGDVETGESLVNLAEQSLDVNRRAVALDSLVRGWPDHPSLGDLIKSNRDSESCIQ